MHGDTQIGSTDRTVPKEVFASVESRTASCAEAQRNASSNNNSPRSSASPFPTHQYTGSETSPKHVSLETLETAVHGNPFYACTDDCDDSELRSGSSSNEDIASAELVSTAWADRKTSQTTGTTVSGANTTNGSGSKCTDETLNVEKDEIVHFAPGSFDFTNAEKDTQPRENERPLASQRQTEVFEASSSTKPKSHFSGGVFPWQQHEATDDTNPKDVEPPQAPTSSRAEKAPHPSNAEPQGNINIFNFGDVITHIHNTAEPSQRDFSAELEKLKRQLKSSAEEICKDLDASDDDVKVTKPVKLQVSSYDGESPQQLDELGHFSRRDEFDVIYSPLKEEVKTEEIFRFAEESAERSGGSLRKKNRILVLGQAGIGKTVLTKILTLMVMRGCDFVFYIHFRDVDFDGSRTLLEILLSSCGCEWKHSEEADAQLWDLLKKSRILIILDGLDEAGSREMLRQSSRCNPLMKSKVSTQLKGLIGGDSLPDAKVVVTSRPREGNGLHRNHKPGTVLQVIGFDEDARREVGRNICGEKWSEVESFLSDHPHVMSICYVPIFCVLVMKVLRINITSRRKITLNSLSKILVSALGSYSNSESMRESFEDLMKISSLAFRGFKRRRYMFDEGDLQGAGIAEGGCQSFLSTWGSSNKVRVLHVGKKSFFSHRVWQELFTAIYLLFFASDEEFDDYLRRIHKRRWETVGRFVFGICNKQVLPDLRSTLGVGSAPEKDKLLQERRTRLQEEAERRLKSLSQNAVNNQTKVVTLLQVCNWFFELGEARGVAMRHFPRNVILQGTIFPSDVTSLTFCLRKCPGDVEMNIRYHTQFVGNAMLMLFRELRRLSVTLRHVTLSRNKISDEAASAIAQCLTSPKTLYIDRSGISEHGIVYIMRAISGLQQPIREVNLTENIISDVAADAVGEAILNINTIFMLKCKITCNGFRLICEGVKRRTEPMSEMNVRGNHVTDDVAVHLAGCLHLISRLFIHQCDVTSTGAKIISTAISKLDTGITDLYLQMNNFGDVGVFEVAQCLHKIRGELRLDKCGCTESGYEVLMEAHQDAVSKPEVYLGYVGSESEEITLGRR